MERRRLKVQELMLLHEHYPGIIQHLAENRQKKVSEIIWAAQEGLLFLDEAAKEIIDFIGELQMLEIAGQIGESLPGYYLPQSTDDNLNESSQG